MKNKLIIFDLDGVMIDSRLLHYEALNDALKLIGEKFIISMEEHLSTYDGLSTTSKLNLLAESKGLPTGKFKEIWESKQIATLNRIPKAPQNLYVKQIIHELKKLGWRVAVASNSIRSTVRVALDSLGILGSVDYFVSNEDVLRPKPFPEMYWKCMTALNCIPKNTIIVEDSHIGRLGATNSGAHLYPVKDHLELNINTFFDIVNNMIDTYKPHIPWRDAKMNVLIPMAGAGSRFTQAGYTFPKPLIEVNGKPMIQAVVENLNIDAHFIFLVQKDHYERYNLKQLLNLIKPNCDIVQVDGITDGAACTALLAKSIINNGNPLLIANSDQLMEWNSNECLYSFSADGIDGGILTFKSSDSKWSFASLNSDGYVQEVAEKKPISDNATVGVYFWKRGHDFVKYAEKMIDNNTRTNGEFYICPVFNEAIRDGKLIRCKKIDKMWGIGTPEDLNIFLNIHADNANIH